MSMNRCFSLLALALVLVIQLPAQTVRVLLVSGVAEILPAGETAARPVVKGESVTVGATITTGADGRVVLTPMPGVKSIITPNSSITLESVSENKTAGAATAYQATLDLKVGAVVSDLNKPADATYDYSVRTPRGLAGARGTTFTVGVNPAGIATVVVAHGTISLTFTDGRTASITPGRVSITKPDGSTVEANSLGDLSPEDQAIAANWTEITLEAIADALDTGVELAPETLQNVLDTANSLGVPLTPEAAASLQRIQAKQTASKNTETPKDNTQARDVITSEDGDDDHSGGGDPDPETAFRNNLTPDQQTAFDALSPTQRSLLVSANDPALTTYVLTPDRTVPEIDFSLALGSTDRTAFLGLSSTSQSLLVSANDPVLNTYAFAPDRSDADIAYVAALTTDQRTAFTALGDTDQTTLISANDPALTTYILDAQRTTGEVAFALALGSTDRTAFLGLSSTSQSLLVSANDPVLNTYAFAPDRSDADIAYVAALTTDQRTAFTALGDTDQSTLISANNPALTTYILDAQRTTGEIAFALALGETDRTAFLGLSPASQSLLAVADDPVLNTYAFAPDRADTDIAYVAGLAPEQRPVFVVLSEPNQSLLIAINDPLVSTVALAGDDITGLPFTDLGLEANLAAILKLQTDSPAGFAFFKAVNGPGSTEGPGPADWSTQAFDRSAATWNALSTDDQNLLLALGATEAVMNRSATFLAAFIAGVRDQPGVVQTAISETGWGYLLFEEYFRDGNYTDDAITAALGLTSAQRALVKFFDLDPDSIIYHEGDIAAQLNLLDSLSTAQKNQLRQLDLQDDLLYNDATEFGTLLDRINALDAPQKQAVLELGLGRFFTYGDGQMIQLENQTSVSVADRLADIADAYLAMSTAQRHALRDIELFDSYYIYLESSDLDPAGLADIADAFLAQSEAVRSLLITGHDYSFYELYIGGGEGSRGLTEFAALVNGLTAAELNTLRDIEGIEIIARALLYEQVDVLATIKTAIAFYDGLDFGQQTTLRELGILQQYDFDWLTSNQAGLDRLLTVYSQLPDDLRAGTTYVNYAPLYTTYHGPSTFINNRYGVYNVSFTTGLPVLHIGAVKDLIIEGTNSNEERPTFQTGAEGALFLHASDLIDLNNVSFGNNIRSITLAAATLNLGNLTFPSGTIVDLKSLYGLSNFDGSSMFGYVNFKGEVYYGTTRIDNQTTLNGLSDYITISTLNGNVIAQ